MRALAFGLVLVLPLAGVTLADDACLTGASTLGDQRALASLRTATESSCPCASAASRGAWQRCARAVLNGAVEAGDLRAACRSTANHIDRGAVCGSSKVACGRYHADASAPRTCRPKRATACHDRTRFEETPCSAETHCADVLDWTAATCVDARENGPFTPGARTLTFTRTSTLQYCTGGTGTCSTSPLGPGCICSTNAACQSNVCEPQSRQLATAIWYPAPPGVTPIDPGYAAVLNAPLAGAEAPYPILLFSHGSCGYPLQSTFLTALLASHGFVVVAPPHPGNTIFEFPSCSSGNSIASAAVERPQDVRFVLDEMLAEDLDSGSPFFGAIDETRVGMSGHSFGGFTTYLAVNQDSRFTVAVPMAPAVPPSHVLTVPSLTMLGQIDSVVSNPAVRDAYDDAQPPKYLVEIAHAGHYAFSNGCFPSPDCNPPTTLTQDEAHDLVLRYLLPFLKLHLADDPAFAPFVVPPAATGTVFEHAP
jgi:predicted dienelactone hydrolase